MGILFFLAAALRIFRLDVPDYQHDEAIYSIFSLNFHDYHFDPVYHGPVLYHIIKLFFVVFGDNDFVARMVSVVMALGTFGLVIGPVRRYLGDRAALMPSSSSSPWAPSSSSTRPSPAVRGPGAGGGRGSVSPW
jgi:predicted membrane-bound mannosyltransferase